MTVSRPCVDCTAEAISSGTTVTKPYRPANNPGHRCSTHHRAAVKARKEQTHRDAKDKQFGLRAGGYDKLLRAQNGACAGCGIVPGPRARRLAVDHDHACCRGNESCGKCVRGLICHLCNDTLASYRDSAERIRGLANYIEGWQSR